MLKKIQFDLKRASTVSTKSSESQTIDEATSQIINGSSQSLNEVNIAVQSTNSCAIWFYTLLSLACCFRNRPELRNASTQQTTNVPILNKATTTKDLDADSIGSFRTRTSVLDSSDNESSVPSFSQSFLSEDSYNVPYTEILSRLRRARQNLISMAMSPTIAPRDSNATRQSISSQTTAVSRTSDSASYNMLTNDTIADLDWCIEQVEVLNTRRISNNASRSSMPLDFRRLFGSDGAATTSVPNPDRSSTTFVPKRISAFGVETPHEAPLALALAQVDSWTIDIFQVDEWSLQRPLTCILYTLFLRRDLLGLLKIPATTFLNFATMLEDKYVKANPFHNSMHAADVTQATHYILNLPSMRPAFSQLEICCAIVAAAVHDVDHPGLTNQYLVNSCSELAIMYNDTSVLENHHLAVTFRLLQNKNCDIFRNIDRKQRQAIRRLIIGIVLSTDMSRHFKLLGKMRAILDRKSTASSRSGSTVEPLRLDNYMDRLVVLENLVHCADLSNPARPLPLYMRWITLLMEEFYRQGDREREAGLEISPMCDRFKARVEKWQVTFIDTFVSGEFECFHDMVKSELKEVMQQLQTNRAYYVARLPPEARPSLDRSVDEASISGRSIPR